MEGRHVRPGEDASDVQHGDNTNGDRTGESRRPLPHPSTTALLIHHGLLLVQRRNNKREEPSCENEKKEKIFI